MLPWSVDLLSCWFCYIASILLFLIFTCAKKKKHENIDKSEQTTDYAWIYVLPAQVPTQHSRSDNNAQTGTDTSKNVQQPNEIIGTDDRGALIHTEDTRGSNQDKAMSKPTPQPKLKIPKQLTKQPEKRTMFEEEGQKEFPNKLILDENLTSIGKVVTLAEKHYKPPAGVRHRKTVYGFSPEESRQKSPHIDKKEMDKFCQLAIKHPPRKTQNPVRTSPPKPKVAPQAHVNKQPCPQAVYGMKSHSDRTKKTAATGSDVFGMMEDTLRRPIERPKKKKKKRKVSLVYL